MREIETILDILEQVEIIGELITEAICEKKFGMRLGFKLIRQMDDIADLASQFDQIIPELKDLDEEEAGRIGSALFSVVRAIQEEKQRHKKDQ